MTPDNALPSPSNDDLEDLLLSCRYGEIDEVREFVTKFGEEAVATVRDENGNTVLHMCCGNGHNDVLDYLLTIIPPSLLSTHNNLHSTPLHWATTNKHLEMVQKLVQFAPGPGLSLIDQKNLAGLTAVGEAERAEWDEGAKWLVSVMDLKTATAEGVGESSGKKVAEEDEPLGEDVKMELEIEDAEGRVQKMTIDGKDVARPEQSN